ncbi:MAG: tetratricopeptide repeat protein [Bacteroidetes bacterium]|nr:tetratricopeptide repeat protein [Bacteroidota bacterium]MBL7105078.1 tetratricopeptide repeat protein [Bacteroidales bacterium]
MKMIKTFGYLIITVVVLSACSSPKEKIQLNIKNLEETLFSDENKMVDRDKASELIDAYIEYADEFPDDKQAPDYLFKAGDMAMNLNMPHKAIEVFDRILQNYPDFEKTPQCLFLKGYVYENNLNDLEEARKIYTEFLEKFPDDEFADDAEVSIKNLGKSPEELIKEFEEQTKKEGDI